MDTVVPISSLCICYSFVFWAILGSAQLQEGGDLGASLGSRAASKLLRHAADKALHSRRPIELSLASKDDAWFQVAHVYSINQVDIGSLEVIFDENSIKVETRDVQLNSSSLINMTSLPLFLDGRRVVLNARITRAFLTASIREPATVKVEQCVLEHRDVDMHIDRAYFYNLLLKLVRGAMSDSFIRDSVCSMLLDVVIDLHEKYIIEVPFVSLVPLKFKPYVTSNNIYIRPRLESVLAEQDQITVKANVEWTEESPTKGSSFLGVVASNSEGSNEDEEQVAPPAQEEDENKQRDPGDINRNESPLRQDGGYRAPVSERLLLWIDDKVLNELLGKFRWDFKWIEEKIPLNSERLPLETRNFFAVICPQCIFLFNITADGLPTVNITRNSIVLRNRNRIAAAVLNPTIGPTGEKKTAIDLVLSLGVELTPQIKDGIFHTMMNLTEKRVNMMNGSAFPSSMNKMVEELLQDLVEEDIWPIVTGELKPLLENKGLELPEQCGVDPQSARLHFEEGKFGVSAALNIEEISFAKCVQEFKNKLPDPSKLIKIKTRARSDGSMAAGRESIA